MYAPAVRRLRLAVSALAAIVSASATAAPDTILTNARVHTPTGLARAVAVTRGRIVAVGSARAVGALRGPATRVVDLHGRALLPGLTDSHVHVLFAGLEMAGCRLPTAADAAATVAAVRACAAAARPGAWIEGGNWVAAAFPAGEQTRALLDRAAPANPVALVDEAHHSVWTNTRGLALAGVTAATRDPPGGVIDRDAAGAPTGILREAAVALLTRAVPPATEAARRAAIGRSTRTMLAHGITAFTDASVRDGNIAALSALSAAGRIAQRVRGCIVWAPPPGEANSMGERLIAARARYETPRLRLDCVKIFLDGVPTESRTGAMLAPYAGADPHAANPRGLLLIDPATLNRAVARFDAMGLSVKFHAAGDAAVREALDAVAAARAANGPDGPVHAVGHSTFVDPADIPRAAPMNAAWEFSPYLWYPTPIASVDIARAVGPERMRGWLPIAGAMETGALVVAGSDWSVVPSVNPWLGMETMVTRQRPGGGPDALNPGAAVPLPRAFLAFTRDGARLMRRPDAGTIEPGAWADLIVTERDPFTVPISDLHRTRVLAVYIAGRLVHGRPPAR